MRPVKELGAFTSRQPYQPVWQARTGVVLFTRSAYRTVSKVAGRETEKGNEIQAPEEAVVGEPGISVVVLQGVDSLIYL